jgi:probable HAF family extracellular repeat protein
MKHIQFATKWSRIARLSLALATLAAPVFTLAQSTDSAGNTRYTIVDLGPVGPASSQAQPFTISGNGLVSGETVLANPKNSGEWVSHAVLWEGTRTRRSLAFPGLGGPNSVAYGVNIRGQAVGQADTRTPDPNVEDFCGSKALGLTQSGNTCVPFIWQNGTMVALPRLRNSSGKEGSNGQALKNNDLGMVAGTAENGEMDSTCPGASVSPQTIEFKPVIWTKPNSWSRARIRELATVDGDRVGIAYAINDLGQAVGASGNCGPFNVIEQNNLIPLHAVLWRNGKAIDLGNLGGDGKFNGIYASDLNDDGQVVGTSDTTGDASFHGFLWQHGHITDLRPLTGDAYSSAIAISNNGLVLGVSIDASFMPRAVLWRNGTAADMNSLVPKSSTLYLESACSINDKGEIIGFAALKNNPAQSHAYLAKPVVNSHGRD